MTPLTHVLINPMTPGSHSRTFTHDPLYTPRAALYLVQDPEKRSSASKLLEHPFVVDCPASHRDLSAPRPAVTEDNPDALEELDQIVASVIKYRKRATIRHNKATVSRQRSEHYHQLGVQLGLRPETVERAFLTATIAVNRELRDQRQKAEAEAAAAAH